MTAHARVRRGFGLRVCAAAVAVSLAPWGTLHADQSTAVKRAAALYVMGIQPKGFATLRNEDSDVLAPGQVMQYRVTLYKQVTYVLFAAGDNSINDLDIYLYDENNNLIDRDTSSDNVPIVSVTPKWTGPFRVLVKNFRGSRGWYHVAVASR